MIRTDGTKVSTPRSRSWKVEFYSLYVALKTDPLILMLFPMLPALEESAELVYHRPHMKIKPTLELVGEALSDWCDNRILHVFNDHDSTCSESQGLCRRT